jgi:hypothetical protein
MEKQIKEVWPVANPKHVHRCLAITEEGPWCANMTEPGRSYCTEHLKERAA